MKLETIAAILKLAAVRLPKSRKSIGYLGWVGHKNLGDDAMFAAAKALVKADVQQYHEVGIERQLVRLGLSGQNKFSQIILGGGTLINNPRLPTIKHAMAQGLRMSALGTGVGDAGFSMAAETLDPQWVEILGRFDFVGVRGELSRGRLAALGVDGVEVVGDLAMALTPEEAIVPSKSKRILVNFSPATTASDLQALQKIEIALGQMIGDVIHQGGSVVPIAFDAADIPALESLMASAGVVDARIEAPTDFTSYLSIARECSFSVGVRLHSNVFAACAGLPFIGFSYRDKCLDFAETVGAAEAMLDFENFTQDQLDAQLVRVLRSGDAIGSELHRHCLSWRETLAKAAAKISS